MSGAKKPVDRKPGHGAFGMYEVERALSDLDVGIGRDDVDVVVLHPLAAGWVGLLK